MKYETLHLDEGEKVILEVRKHWIVFFEHAVGLVLAATMPFVVFVLLKIYLPNIFTISISVNASALFVYLYCLWLLVLWLSFFINWTMYYLDVWYVTEKRIIAIDQKHIFSREVSNIRFDRVQDVTVHVHGFIATFLDFGSIEVQTASEDLKDFKMSTVRKPQEVRRIIFNQQNINSSLKNGV